SRLSDDGLKKEILRLMEFGCAQGDPASWLDMACARFGDVAFWHDAAIAQARNCVSLLIAETERDIAEMDRRGGGMSAINTLNNDLSALRELEKGEWQDFLSASPFGRKAPRRKDEDPELDEYMKLRREERKKYFSDHVDPIFLCSFADYEKEIEAMLPQMETLAHMTKTFVARYTDEKLKHSSLDFSDLELYVVKLLTENPALAKEYQSFFKEVLVDEYQDINPLQDKILTLLAGKGRLFTVGDIKQSIYGFRLADHTLFRDRSLSYQKDAPNENGLLIHLNKNFRSRADVLSVTNEVFTSLMNEDVSGIPYGEDEMLRFGAEYYPPREDSQVDVDIVVLERPRSDPHGDYESLACHGRYVAKRIRQMMAEGYEVTDKDGPRPLRYGDITVLMRSANTGGEEVGAALIEANIPVETPKTMGFLSGRETKLLASFLSVLDNPRQDIPLGAVMRSPLFAFDEDELLALAGSRKGRKLWDMVCQAENLGRDMIPLEKVAAFRQTIEEWRLTARIYPVGDLVDMILKAFDYSAFWGGLPNGRRRIKNIRLFAEEAMAYQNDESGGLFDFLRYLDHLAETGGDIPEEGESDEDCVRIMNIHKSKGLEFPVVFLIQAEKRFNKSDLRDHLILDKDLGLGPCSKDMKKRLVTPTLPHLLIRNRRIHADLAEEMRVLYVALTRAKERLIITSADKATKNESVAMRLCRTFDAVRYDTEPRLPATLVLGDHCYADWIFHGLSKGQRLADADFAHRADLHVEIALADAPMGPVEIIKEKRTLAPEELERLKKALTRKEEKRLPAKVSVTSLLPRGSWEGDYSPTVRPRFMEEKERISAAERGTAFHTFMEHLPFDMPWDEAALNDFAQNLVAEHILTSADLVDMETVLAFLASDYGKELRTAAKVRRELAFVCRFNAEELFDDDSGDHRNIILQGAIDLIYRRENGEWVLLDYKTNDLSRCGKEAFLAKYTRQMELYTAALEKVYGIRVSHRAFFLTKTKEFLPC
ncbi:MAG: UvrD-helicase domain-containing protein, partial [Firmicutes bacterium]|nr:UvrD-helicase domain-containing protein [Bacillota bacterium]